MPDESLEEIMARAIFDIQNNPFSAEARRDSFASARALLSALAAAGYEIRKRNDGMIAIPEIDPRRPFKP